MLTARNPLNNTSAEYRVRRAATGEWVAASSAWLGLDMDAALLKLDITPSSDTPPAQFGALTGPGPVDFEAVGFPAMSGWSGGKRLTGTIQPPRLSWADSSMLSLRGRFPDPTVDPGVDPRGMRGAAVFSGPFLVGVLLSAQPDAPTRYSAVSATAILADPGFRSSLIGEHVATPVADNTQQPPHSEAGELTLGTHEGGITTIAVTGDGTIVSAGWNGTIKVWNVEAPAAVLSIVAHEGWVRAVALTELDGRQVIVSAGGVDGHVGLWDLATGSSIGAPLVGHIGGVNALAVGISDGRPLAVSGGDDGTIRRWDLRALSPLGEPLRGHQGYVPALAVGMLDGRPVIVSGGDDGTIRVWDLASGTVIAAPLTENPGKIEAVSVSMSQGRPVVISASDGMVYVCDLATGEQVLPAFVSERVTSLAVGELEERSITVSGGKDRKVRVWDLADGTPIGAPLLSDEGAVNAVVVGSIDGRSAIISGGDDGTVHAWPLDTLSATLRREQVEWVTDAPALRDELNREPLADALVERLRRLGVAPTPSQSSSGDEPHSSFLIHLDGRWGTGKSSILNFVKQKLEIGTTPWLVVEFNAWRQVRLGPAWWTLLTTLRYQMSAKRSMPRRFVLRCAEAMQRIRRTGAPYILAVALLLAALVAAIFAVSHRGLNSASARDVAATVTAIVGAVVVLWAGAVAIGRFLLWDSPAGARLFERSNANPMDYVRGHFGYLVRRAGRPVVFLVDDLDRCDKEYVVELLDDIQTLIRDSGSRHSRNARAGGPYFVVAADGAWIRASYEDRYSALAPQVSEPGQSLGYLFLDKIFQLTATVPSLSGTTQDAFLRRLLAERPDRGSDEGMRLTQAKAQIADSRSDREIREVVEGAPSALRDELVVAAVEKLTDEAVEAQAEHDLQKFAPLFDRNPRRMKRFLNTYKLEQVRCFLEQNIVEENSLALWTLVRMRWPLVGDYLCANPAAMDGIAGTKSFPDDVDPVMQRLLELDELKSVVTFRPGGPLTAGFVRMVSGRTPRR